ncbi:hypothetical protein QBC39DRAFT_267933 [Podospora conica]|nr:hypothetical protein QBC39DRAFT_267933 [Schizothecium conicum]
MAFNSAQCCNLAQSRNLFVDPPPAANISCGHVYINESIPAVNSLYVSYQFCKSECPGYDKSEWNNPGEWAAPIVQFLLPSIIFSMSIPRHVQFLSTDILEEAWIKETTGPIPRMAISLSLLLPAIACAALDTIIWVILIMSMAGPMMVAGLHEAVLDYKILRALIAKDSKVCEGGDDEQLTTAVELLVTVVSGNLRLGDHDSVEPSSAIIDALTGKKESTEGMVSAAASITGQPEDEAVGSVHSNTPSTIAPSTRTTTTTAPLLAHAAPTPKPTPPSSRFSPSHIAHIPSRLTRLVTSQLPFGAIVGAPVVFYLGAFIYTVLDLLDNPSDQDRAISIAYGVEWMIIVHVAIVSGTLLASNNPSPVAVLVGRLPAGEPRGKTWLERMFPPVYPGTFGTVSMWRRGVNKRAWLERTRAWRRGTAGGFRAQVAMGWWEWAGVGVFTFVLISLPAAAGAFVSWRTPPVGFSCRSLSFVLYMAWEIVLTPVYFVWLEARGEVGVVEWCWEALEGVKRRAQREWLPLRLRSVSRRVVGVLKSPMEEGSRHEVEMVGRTGVKAAEVRVTEVAAPGSKWSLESQMWLFLAFVMVFTMAVFTSIVLTLMQIIGVYRNCFCYVTTEYWFRLNEAKVPVASDTIEQRGSSDGWVRVGIAATSFMAVCALLAWWFQRYIRGLYELAIKRTVVRLVVQEPGKHTR